MKILVFLMLFAGICSGMTRAEIRTQVRFALRDTGPTSAEYYWSDENLNTKINLVQQNIAGGAKFLTGTYSTSTVMGQREYSVPSDLIMIEKVGFWISPSTVAFRRLEYKSIDNLDSENPNWQNASTGKPLYYYQRGDNIGLYPSCSAAYSTTSIGLQIEYVKQADNLSSDSSVPFDAYPLLIQYHDMIVAGVVDLCRMGGFSNNYYALINKMKQELAENPDWFWNKRLYERR